MIQTPLFLHPTTDALSPQVRGPACARHGQPRISPAHRCALGAQPWMASERPGSVLGPLLATVASAALLLLAVPSTAVLGTLGDAVQARLGRTHAAAASGGVDRLGRLLLGCASSPTGYELHLVSEWLGFTPALLLPAWVQLVRNPAYPKAGEGARTGARGEGREGRPEGPWWVRRPPPPGLGGCLGSAPHPHLPRSPLAPKNITACSTQVAWFRLLLAACAIAGCAWLVVIVFLLGTARTTTRRGGAAAERGKSVGSSRPLRWLSAPWGHLDCAVVQAPMMSAGPRTAWLSALAAAAGGRPGGCAVPAAPQQLDGSAGGMAAAATILPQPPVAERVAAGGVSETAVAGARVQSQAIPQAVPQAVQQQQPGGTGRPLAGVQPPAGMYGHQEACRRAAQDTARASPLYRSPFASRQLLVSGKVLLLGPARPAPPHQDVCSSLNLPARTRDTRARTSGGPLHASRWCRASRQAVLPAAVHGGVPRHGRVLACSPLWFKCLHRSPAWLTRHAMLKHA